MQTCRKIIDVTYCQLVDGYRNRYLLPHTYGIGTDKTKLNRKTGLGRSPFKYHSQNQLVTHSLNSWKLLLQKVTDITLQVLILNLYQLPRNMHGRHFMTIPTLKSCQFCLCLCFILFQRFNAAPTLLLVAKSISLSLSSFYQFSRFSNSRTLLYIVKHLSTNPFASLSFSICLSPSLLCNRNKLQ